MLSDGIAGSSSSTSMSRPVHRDFYESSKARGSRGCRIALHCRNAQLVAADDRGIYLRRARITPRNRRGKTSPAAKRWPSRIASSILTWSGKHAKRAHSHTIQVEGARDSVYESHPKEIAALTDDAAPRVGGKVTSIS
jgi:hypothetical protein